MTRAYRLGNPLLTANLSYCGIVFSSVLGVIVWQDKLSWLGWMGMLIILISGVLATWLHAQSVATQKS
jgi:S-adenosylmethionine uptake transporter